MRKYLLVGFTCMVLFSDAQQLYEMPKAVASRLISFENPNGLKGSGGKTNKKAKGNAFEMLNPRETKTLIDINGQGIIQRFTSAKSHYYKNKKCTINESKFKIVSNEKIIKPCGGSAASFTGIRPGPITLSQTFLHQQWRYFAIPDIIT